MKTLVVSSSKGQLKIQQMAFVLVALMIFMSFVALIFVSLRVANLKGDVNSLKEEEAREVIRKISSLPEFSFQSKGDCSQCIDLDKVLLLKERNSYKGFWDFDYLAIGKIYPSSEGECLKENYPNCATITLINKSSDVGAITRSFVSICRWESSKEGYFKCEMGQVLASGGSIK